MAEASLSDMMAKRYGGGEKESAAEDKAEGGEDAEGARLGTKLSSALKGGDGESIYNAYAALHAYCSTNS
jgi:hypothetical protein